MGSRNTKPLENRGCWRGWVGAPKDRKECVRRGKDSRMCGRTTEVIVRTASGRYEAVCQEHVKTEDIEIMGV